MLSGGYLIVLRFGQDTQLPQLSVQLLHEGGDTGLDGAKVVIVQLLPLGGLGAEQGPAGIDQVLALLIQSLVDQEIFLLWTTEGVTRLTSSLPNSFSTRRA